MATNTGKLKALTESPGLPPYEAPCELQLPLSRFQIYQERWKGAAPKILGYGLLLGCAGVLTYYGFSKIAAALAQADAKTVVVESRWHNLTQHLNSCQEM